MDPNTIVMIGNAVIKFISLFADKKQNQNEILQKLIELENLVKESVRRLENKIENVTLRNIAGEVSGINESLNEYRVLKINSLLEKLAIDSAMVKSKIILSIEDEEIPAELRSAYCTLYCIVVPLRVAILGQLDPNSYDLVIEELNELSEMKDVILSIVDSYGRNRVSKKVKSKTVDVYKTRIEMKHQIAYFTIVDGKEWHLIAPIVGQGESDKFLEDAKQKREKLASEIYRTTIEPFQIFFNNLENSMKAL